MQPTPDGGPHRVQIGDNESPFGLQHSKHFSIVRREIGQIALVQVRYGQIETTIVEETQGLDVGNAICILTSLELSGGLDHLLAGIQAQHVPRSTIEEHPAKPALAPAVAYRKTTNVSTTSIMA